MMDGDTDKTTMAARKGAADFMDQLVSGENYSPYRIFTAEKWAKFRADTPLTLTEDEVQRLRSLNDPVDLEEVRRIYLSMSRLLSAHVEATQLLFRQRQVFFNSEDVVKSPFIIGIAGSVAVGKSTTARVLQELLTRWPSSPKVDLVTTDGFLYPNEVLRRENLMERKGFPESFDLPALLKFLDDVKAGRAKVKAPVYSHFHYDILPGNTVIVDRPHILIVEGLNVLQPARLPKDGKAIPFVSDYFDFSIYIDAEAEVIEQWYLERFMRLRETAFRDPGAYFHRYSKLSDEEGEFFKTLIALLETDIEQAAALLEKNITPQSSAVMDFMLGTIRMQLGSFDKAVAAYEKAATKFPNFMRAYKNLGIAYVQSGELEKGAKALIKGMELGGADALSYGLLGYSYLNQGKYASALNAYSLAMAFDPASKDWKLGKIRSLAEMDDYEQAAGLIKELLEQDPGNHELYMHLANLSLAREETQSAMANLEIVRRMNEGSEASLFLLADIYANQSMYRLAIDVYREALAATQNKSERFESVRRAIRSLIENDAWERAAELIEVANAAFGEGMPRDQRLALLNLQAEYELGSRQSAEAAKTLEKIIEEDPMNGRAILLLARYYQEIDNREEAEFLYERASNIEEVAAKALLQHGQMLVESRDYAEAAKLIRQSLDRNYEPNVADYLRAVEEAVVYQ